MMFMQQLKRKSTYSDLITGEVWNMELRFEEKKEVERKENRKNDGSIYHLLQLRRLYMDIQHNYKSTLRNLNI